MLKDKEKGGQFYAVSHKKELIAFLLVSIAILAIMTYCSICLGCSSLDAWLDASSIFVLIPAMVIAIFFINRDCDDTLENRMITTMSSTSFGVYIYHMVWINVLYKVVKVNPFSHGIIYMFVCLLLVFVFIYIASVAATLITKRIPGLKRLF